MNVLKLFYSERLHIQGAMKRGRKSCKAKRYVGACMKGKPIYKVFGWHVPRSVQRYVHVPNRAELWIYMSMNIVCVRN